MGKEMAHRRQDQRMTDYRWQGRSEASAEEAGRRSPQEMLSQP